MIFEIAKLGKFMEFSELKSFCEFPNKKLFEFLKFSICEMFQIGNFRNFQNWKFFGIGNF